MRAVVEAMAHRLDVDAVWIRTPNERGNHMVLQAFYAAQPELSAALERMISAPEMRDDPLVVHLMQHRQPVLISGGDAHDGRDHYVEQQYLPDNLKGRRYYVPSDQGIEKRIKERLENLRDRES